MTDSDLDHLDPSSRFVTHQPCTDPSHQKAIAEAAELRRLVDALILNVCPRDLANAMRHLSEGRELTEREGEAAFERELTAAEFRHEYEGSGS